MDFKKISAPSLKELFVQELENMILSDKLPVGEKLPPERELAESMQVSRAVVNAGINDLAKKGFLIIKPRIGTFVADYRRNGTMDTLISIMNYNGGILREAEIRSILELRIAFDSMAIRLGVPKMSDEDIHTLRAHVNSIIETDSMAKASEHAFLFQHELACLSGNTLLPLIFSSFKIPILSLWERFCRLYGIELLYTNTNELMNYIEQREAELAVKCITDTINATISGDNPIYY